MNALPQTQMTSAEKMALANWQSRINESGEIMPEPTIIQETRLTGANAVQGVPMEVYHGERYKDYLSSGKLSECKTPLHLKRALEGPAPASVHLNIGAAFHELILEPEQFSYRLFDDSEICTKLINEGSKSPRATNKYKEWRAKFEDENGNFAPDVLPREAFTSMWKLKKILRNDPVVCELFNGSRNELSHFLEFDHPVKHTGSRLKVKVRPDGLKIASDQDAENFEAYGIEPGDLIIISVKTTIDASPDGFYRQARKNQYNLSEAFYADVLQRYYENRKIHTVFLTLEKDGQVFTGHYLLRYCSTEFINSGRELYRQNLEVYCSSNDLSEGYQSFTKSSIVEI